MTTDKTMLATGVPKRRKYMDCAGVEHEFEHTPHELPGQCGWSMYAVEVNPPTCPGYRFRSDVCTSLYTAYLDVHRQIERAMARKHIQWEGSGAPDMFDGVLAGEIAYNGLVIDGQLMKFADLQRLLTTYEGFPVKISIEQM